MIRSIPLFVLLAFCWACNSKPSARGVAATAVEEEISPSDYGQPISAENALPAAQVPQLLQNNDSLYVKLRGNALSSCTKKGCWMMVSVDKAQDMRVTFKDYAFFVPKDLNGEPLVMEGILKRKISSVEEQQHFAEDAGKSKQEIESIQLADTVYSFEAVGVKIWPLTDKH